MSQNTNNDEKYQIISDSEYIQNQKRIPDKLNFNLEALEYQPKELNQYNEDDDDDEEFDELMKEELDKIIGDIIEKEAFEELRKYYDTNLLSNMMAPMIPAEHARNCLWVLKVREDWYDI